MSTNVWKGGLFDCCFTVMLIKYRSDVMNLVINKAALQTGTEQIEKEEGHIGRLELSKFAEINLE